MQYMYYSQHKYDDTKDAFPNTFSLTIYKDCSFTFCYAAYSTVIFGVWASKASIDQKNAIRYHNEIISSSYLVDGSDVLFCPLLTYVAMRDSCVSAESNVELLWNKNNVPACSALGEKSSQHVERIWTRRLYSCL